jgi:predicted ATPase/DNA-binding winged helix-turn-helix (wHTH) protein
MAGAPHWHFAAFRLDQDNACVWHGAELLALRPKTFAVLHYLVAHAGQLVTKAALLEAVWPKTAVSDTVLKDCMHELRRALGDTARTPQCIATVHRRGYRFIAPVTVMESAPATAAQAMRAGERTALTPAPALPPVSGHGPTSSAQLVAREAELATLHQWFTKALRGERHLGFITGEAGIGKTTLLDAFLAQLTGQAPLWIGYGHCIEQYGAGEAYLPLLEALGQMGRTPDGPQLVALLRQQAPSWLLQLPALLSPAEYEALQRYAGGTTRERMLRELTEAIEALAAARPCVLVLEDLHWSDTATIEWLAYVARRRGPARLLVLGTYRPVETLVRAHPVRAMVQALTLHGQGTELALEAWSAAGVAAYLAQRGSGTAVPDGLVQVLTQRTDGHPLFLVALLDELLRQGLVRVGPTGWALAGGLEAVTVGVPQSIRHLLERQVAQLRPADQELLAAASVAGVEFAVAAVAAGVAQMEEDVEAQCDTLARRHQVVQASGTVAWPDGTVTARYKFRHALYQELIYERVPVSRRVRWHRQIGQRLETGYGQRAQESAAELAEHFVRTQDGGRAVQYLRYAGENALRRSANQEAVRCFEQALDVLRHQHDGRATHEQAIDLRLALRPALAPLGEHRRLLDHLHQAAALAEALHDHRRLSQVAGAMAASLWQLGDHDGALAAAQRALAMATSLGDISLQATAHAMVGEIYLWSLSDYQRAAEVYSRHVEPVQGALRRERFGVAAVPAVVVYANLAVCFAELGAFAEGRVYGGETLRLAEAAEHPYSLAVAYVGVGHYYLRQGALPQAIRMLEQGLALCDAMHFSLTLRLCKVRLGAAYALAGRVSEALPLLEQALERLVAMQHTILYPFYAVLVGEGYVLASRVAEAMSLGQRALEAALARKQQGYQAYALRLLGDSAAQCEPPDIARAEIYYRQALTLADALGMRPLVAHCHLGLGTLYLKIGRREETRANLTTVMEMYRIMEMHFWLPQAEAALAQVDTHKILYVSG